jgi:hypothetical protein
MTGDSDAPLTMTLYEEELKKLGYTLIHEAMPPTNQPVFVVTSNVRCLALYEGDGRWISQDGRKEMENVVGWVPWPQPVR